MGVCVHLAVSSLAVLGGSWGLTASWDQFDVLDVISAAVNSLLPVATCGTESMCGDEGGFCIPDSEHCNGNIIKGEGYCNQVGGCQCCLNQTVYMRDIENTIAYTLRNRVPYEYHGHEGGLKKTLNQIQLTALSTFAEALHTHLPLSSPVETFLKCLIMRLSNETTSSGEKLIEIYGKCEGQGSELPRLKTWVGCRNTNNISTEQDRSYPCGLWITFHAITVNLEDKAASSVLPTLHGVVEYFPWCTICQSHFMEMYKDLDGVQAVNMDTAEKVTMWLWRAHNKVTERVKEDLRHPNPGRSQLQFPGIEQCPNCSTGIPFIPFKETEVYSYLRRIYNKIYN